MSQDPASWRHLLLLDRAIRGQGRQTIAALAELCRVSAGEIVADLIWMRDVLGLPLRLDYGGVRLEDPAEEPAWFFDRESLLASGTATFRKRHPPQTD